MDYRDIQKLIAFFSALQDSGFKQDLKQIPSSVMIDGQRTPVDKSYCLLLLRRLPQFQGDKFKDDNAIIKHLSDPNNRKFLLGNFTQAQQVELTKVLEEKPAAVEVSGEQIAGGETSTEQQTQTGEPAETMAGLPGLPSAPSVPSGGRRIIYNVPRTPEPDKPELVIANKSGAVREAGDASKLVTASKSGVVKETPPSKIFVADKSGKVVGERTITPAQRLNWTGFKMPASFTNVAKNFGSNAQIFIKKNLGRLGRGIGEIAKGIGRGIAGPGLTGAYNLLGKAGSGTLRAFERLNSPGLRGATRSFASSGSKKLVWSLFLGLFFFVFFSGLLGGITNTTPSGQAAPAPGFIGTLPPSNPDCPKLHDEIYNQFKVDFDQKNPFSCDYLQWAWENLWNISNTKFLDLVRGPDKNKIITVKREDKGFNEQVDCPSIIMSGISSATGKPYSESLFKLVFIHELAHVIENCNRSTSNIGELSTILSLEGGISTFSQNPTRCISGVTQLNEDFAETLAYYLNPKLGEQSYFSSCQPQKTTNPTLRGDKPLHQQFAQSLLGTTSPSPATGQKFVASCPIPNGNIICPSYGKIVSGEVIEDPTCVATPKANPDETDIVGHCGPLYREKYPDICTDDNYISGVNLRRTAKSIDIVNQSTVPGQEAFLPNIKGQTLKWYYKGVVSAGGDYGFIRLFESEPTSDGIWSLHYTHVNSSDPPLSVGVELRSGQVAATLIKQTDKFTGEDDTHLHFTIGLNVGDSTSDLKDFSAGWKFPDRDLGVCAN